MGIYRQFTHISTSGTQSGRLLEEEEFNSIETVMRSMSDKFQTLYTGGDMNLNIARQEDNGYYEEKRRISNALHQRIDGVRNT